MKWSVRSWIIGALSLVAVSTLSTAWAQAETPRGLEPTRYRFDDLADWILQVRPEVADRPVSLVLLWNRTDTVWGRNEGYQVLPNVWRNQLLAPVLDSFLVQGYERSEGVVEGDRIMMMAFGRWRVDTVVPDQPFTRESRLQILNAYPTPFAGSEGSDQGLNHNLHLNEALASLPERYRGDNVLLLMVTDGIEQVGTTLRIDEARDFRNYRAFWTDELNREFMVYLYWNDFPKDVRFVYYDEGRDGVEPHPRTERAPAQRDNLLQPDDYGTEGEGGVLPRPQALTFVLTGDGQGAVRSAPAGIDTTAGALTASYGRGATVTLTATPAGRSRFAGFQGADGVEYPCGEGSGPGRCVVTMDAQRSVYGAFVLPAPFNWWPLIATAVVLALLAFTAYVWLSERYDVRDENGLLDRTVHVFPAKAKRIPVPNPAQPTEVIGHLSVALPLPFGLSRLLFTPVKGVAVTLAGKRGAGRGTADEVGAGDASDGGSAGGRGRSARGRRRGGATKRKPKALTLRAGQRKPERIVLHYRKVEAPGTPATAADEVQPDAPATANAGTVALLLQRHVGGRAGKQRRRRSKASKDGERRTSDKRSGSRGNRRVELTDEGEGDSA